MRVIFGRQLRVESDGWAGLASLNKLDPTAASQTYPCASRAAHGEHMLLQRMQDTRLMQDTLCGTLSRPDPGHSVARSISPTQSLESRVSRVESAKHDGTTEKFGPKNEDVRVLIRG